MVQNYVKNYDDKIIANIFCDVHYYPTKFEIKIQLVYGEIKKSNSVRGKIELNCIV